MRYSTDAALCEVRARSARLRIRRERRVTTALSGASTMLAAALFACFYLLQPLTGSSMSAASFGAFLLSGEAGGYVLVGVIAFALGVALVILITRRHRSASRERIGGDQK